MKKEIKPYAFIDREGNKVTRESYMAKMAKKVGRAYGFFYCDVSKQEIETELPTIRELVKTPSQLELSLIEGMNNLKGDKRLTALAQELAEQDGINYVLKATYPSGTNRDTADEVASIINQAYQSPLYETNAPFKGAVVYEEKGDYFFRDYVFRD